MLELGTCSLAGLLLFYTPTPLGSHPLPVTTTSTTIAAKISYHHRWCEGEQMGIGCALDCRWVFRIQSHLPSSPLSATRHQLLFSCKFRGAFFEPPKVSSLCTITNENGNVPSHFSEYFILSAGAPETLEKDFTEVDKVNVHGKNPNVNHRLCTSIEKPVDEDILKCRSYLSKDNFMWYGFLMESLDKIEDVLVDSDVKKLERDILIQIEKLGALQYFQSSVSRTVSAEDVLSTMFSPTPENPNETHVNLQDDCIKKDSIFIHSMKKEARKTKRERALEKVSRIPALSLPSAAVKHIGNSLSSTSNPTSRSTDLSNSTRRTLLARKESKLSAGVKEVSELEHIHQKLEEQIGRPPSFASWAEAAKVDEKTLKQHLHFGWYCRDELLRSARSLVVYIAKGYSGMGLGFEDLVQAGFVGLLLGAERFDSTRGHKFSTYVRHWIRKSMSAFVAQHSRGVRLPATMEKIIRSIRKTKKSFLNSKGICPHENEIAELTGIPLAKIKLANRLSSPVGSLDQTLRGSWHIKHAEITPDTSVEAPDNEVMQQHLRNDLHKVLGCLNDRERQVLLLRYGFRDGRCKSLSEIGQYFHVSKEWIRKMEKASFSKLRAKRTQEELKHYLNIRS